MAEQLDSIARLMRDRKVWLTVVPFAAGAYASIAGMLQLMEFDDAPPLAYTETAFPGTLIDDPAVVKRAERAYDFAGGVPGPGRVGGGGLQTMHEYDLSKAHWRKSSSSNGDGGNCVEVAVPDLVPVRDSKLGTGSPVLAFPAHAWTGFLGLLGTRG
jgi:hypothetical protein